MKIVRVCIGPDHIVDSIKTVTSNRVEFQNTGWDMLSWVLDHDFLAEDWDDGVDTSQLNGIPNFITLVTLCF